MLTIHRVRAVRLVADGPEHDGPERDGGAGAGYAVVVEGDRFAAVGPYDELFAQYGARARVREWDGVLTPGRYEPEGAALLEAAYHPDPREADALGSEPVTGEALAALDMTEARWGGSARRGLQRLMATGTTALTGPFRRPAVRTAVERSGLQELAGRIPRALAAGGPAHFAVFAEDGSCLATALHGRLVFRRR
ncbi:hypothetical protein [Streptomyces sp. KS_16]|uniref:imidazolonepropionase-like domain-containing protein n=1 Tax=unclassified Streptomyces TaxID=2593676 RepID=UPI00088481B6|nr:hypothetical protein BX261_3162 [Streptomyces sp. 2321.6]SDR44078.1 hypothetical protein SAMN05216511_4038 [Streptomyces sp. KS_16]SEC89078.1 hypothetical protein SAMN05428940_3165 [Streptomyces sp. 2133.1]SNC69309.1 hypothetical protein SAMN06272741_3157 [Streptomyces sp. 2114.4]